MLELASAPKPLYLGAQKRQSTLNNTFAFALAILSLVGCAAAPPPPQRPKASVPPPTSQPRVEKEPPPAPKPEPMRVAGQMAPGLIKQVVRNNFDVFAACYERGLARNSELSGIVKATFVIATTGAVEDVRDGGSSLPDPKVVKCVLDAFGTLQFPPPEAGIVLVTYPIALSPG